LASGAAQAVPYVGNFNTGAAHDGVLLNVNGFDIYSNGSAAFFCTVCTSNANGTQLDPTASTTAPVVVGDIVTTFYQGVVNAFNPGVAAPNLNWPGNAGGTYQLTVAAVFQEAVVGVAPGFALLQPLNGGRVSVFYDSNDAGNPSTFISAVADIFAGVGYTDGILIADGAVSQPLSLLTTAVTDGTNASGQANIGGLLGFAQLGSTIPDVVGFLPTVPNDYTSTTTLQFGPNIAPDFQTVNFFDNVNGWASQAVNAALTQRADANVDLSSVPEPGTVALLGVCLAAIGMSLRRRAA
jgi:hypothetical protein